MDGKKRRARRACVTELACGTLCAAACCSNWEVSGLVSRWRLVDRGREMLKCALACEKLPSSPCFRKLECGVHAPPALFGRRRTKGVAGVRGTIDGDERDGTPAWCVRDAASRCIVRHCFTHHAGTHTD
eukprot:366443-Chlamydomonas_euryale.AAC.14